MAFSFNFDIKAKQDEYCQDETSAGNDHESCLKTVSPAHLHAITHNANGAFFEVWMLIVGSRGICAD